MKWTIAQVSDSGRVHVAGVGGMKIASAGARGAARVLDTVLMVFVGWLLFVGLGDQEFAENKNLPFWLALAGGMALVNFIYEVFFLVRFRATLGKMAMGIVVISAVDGQRLTVSSAVRRQLIPLLGFFIVGVGLLAVYGSILLDKTGRRQGWHDAEAHDLVVWRR